MGGVRDVPGIRYEAVVRGFREHLALAADALAQRRALVIAAADRRRRAG